LVSPSNNSFFAKSISAGTTVRWMIYPTDAAGNNIIIDANSISNNAFSS